MSVLTINTYKLHLAWLCFNTEKKQHVSLFTSGEILIFRCVG